ncbi:retrovirus-related pol polyprotein from transposon TNT 1-94 [Tanacetum coccineum]
MLMLFVLIVENVCFILNHDACVSKYLNDVNARAKKPKVVSISARKPKNKANKSVATPHKKTVAPDTTIQKSKSYFRELYENTNREWKWWIEKQSPLGYKWTPKPPKTKKIWMPKIKTENVSLSISPTIDIISRITNVLKISNSLGSNLLNVQSSSNSLEDCSTHPVHCIVHFGNDQFAPILGYGDLIQGNVMIKQVYYVEGLNHNLFSVGQFCDADLEVAFRKSMCYVRDLQGNDILTAWLWHRRLSHLNFDYINLLSKKDIVIGLPKLKYAKDQLCSSCEVSKAKRSSFKTKAIPSSKGRLNLLHMDLCGPIDGENLDKMKEKGDPCVMVGYSTQSKGYHVYNKRTCLIVESIHIKFDEIKDMTSDQNSSGLIHQQQMTPEQHNSGLGPHAMTSDQNSSGLTPQRQMTSEQHSSGLGPHVMTSDQNSPVPPRQEMSVVNNSSGLVLQEQQKASDYDNSDLVPPLQAIVPPADKTYFVQKSTSPTDNSKQKVTQSTANVQQPSTPTTNVNAKDNNNDQPEDASFQNNDFINPFFTPVQEIVESSSHNINNSNMHTFYQPHGSEYRWTKDHPLEQVHGNPSKPVQTRRQLITDPEMCMFALTVSTPEPKNIKEAMADSAWIEAMQEELYEFNRLQVWELVNKPFGKIVIKIK